MGQYFRSPFRVKFDAEFFEKEVGSSYPRCSRFEGVHKVVDEDSLLRVPGFGGLDGNRLVDQQDLALVLETGNRLHIDAEAASHGVAVSGLNVESEPLLIGEGVGDGASERR